MMRPGMTIEQWGDVVSLGLLTVMWAVMLYFEITRTWRWDALGRALTVLTGCLLLSYGFATLSSATTINVWVPSVRWVTRIALGLSGSITIVVLAADRQPPSTTWNPDHRDRRIGPLDRRTWQQERNSDQ